MSQAVTFEQNTIVESSAPNFNDALQAAVDYRGDVTLSLVDGTSIIGFAFNINEERLDYFPSGQVSLASIPLNEITKLEFTGFDTAKGKSWEDYQRRKAAGHAEENEEGENLAVTVAQN